MALLLLESLTKLIGATLLYMACENGSRRWPSQKGAEVNGHWIACARLDVVLESAYGTDHLRLPNAAPTRLLLEKGAEVDRANKNCVAATPAREANDHALDRRCEGPSRNWPLGRRRAARNQGRNSGATFLFSFYRARFGRGIRKFLEKLEKRLGCTMEWSSTIRPDTGAAADLFYCHRPTSASTGSAIRAAHASTWASSPPVIVTTPSSSAITTFARSKSATSPRTVSPPLPMILPISAGSTCNVFVFCALDDRPGLP